MKMMTIGAVEENVEDVIEFVMGELLERKCDEEAMMQVELAIEEIFVNIASYAYGDEIGEAEIAVEVNEHPPYVVITFVDHGVPFDPVSYADADTSKEALEEREGGLGILVVKKSMDEVNYSFKNGENILTIKKGLDQGVGTK